MTVAEKVQPSYTVKKYQGDKYGTISRNQQVSANRRLHSGN